MKHAASVYAKRTRSKTNPRSSVKIYTKFYVPGSSPKKEKDRKFRKRKQSQVCRKIHHQTTFYHKDLCRQIEINDF